MEPFSALLAICAGNSPASREFPAKRPVTRSFDVFFDLCLNKRFRKQSWGWWFETLSLPLWRHCNVTSNMDSNVRKFYSNNSDDQCCQITNSTTPLTSYNWQHFNGETLRATRRKNSSQWYRSFRRKLRSHWLKFLRHVAITLVIQGPGLLEISFHDRMRSWHETLSAWWPFAQGIRIGHRIGHWWVCGFPQKGPVM